MTGQTSLADGLGDSATDSQSAFASSHRDGSDELRALPTLVAVLVVVVVGAAEAVAEVVEEDVHDHGWDPTCGIRAEEEKS